ncbi:IS1380 family transposase [Xylanimonas allomyrinae]|uniref:IS1380 family transposase n=1 Tax=Xylanimonas allomyrinae TaxID=2509459 RepID=UPI003CCC5365
MRACHGVVPVFDDPKLVSAAGLVPVLELAESAGLSEAIDEACTLPAANLAAKVRTVVAGMLAGADSIDDLNLLRAGGTARVLGPVRAPSTIGTFLRSFTHGHVLQLHAAHRRLLGGLAAKVPALVGEDDLVFVDVDDTIREVHGYAKDGAGFGYSGVRGLNAMITTISTPSTAPLIAECSLRQGSTRSGKSADWHLKRTLTTVKAVTGPAQRVWVRGDSAFATAKNVAAALKAGAWFSFTIPAWRTVTTAISQIPEQAWTAIQYPNAILDEETGQWVSEAEVAETSFTAFVSKKKSEQVVCRLVVRRVKRLGQAPATGQGELFDVYRHHAFITNTTLPAVEADRYHRGHAIVEQVIAELKAGPLAHLPSGKFAANAAWLAFAAMAFNISRAAAVAAGTGKARMATMLRTIISTPARLAATGRRLVMHLPDRWPWQAAWTSLWDHAVGPPAPATS